MTADVVELSTRARAGDGQNLHPARARHLDALRGLAVVLMVADHLCLLVGEVGLLFRLTGGRLAMPLFFLLAGHLVQRVGKRTAWVALVGLALPLLAPWIDSPNVLLWYAVGACVVVAARVVGLPLWLVAAVALAFSANRYELLLPGQGYDPLALVGLMALGAWLPRDAFDFARRLPGFLAYAGRYPLSVYVGHVLALSVVTGSLVLL